MADILSQLDNLEPASLKPGTNVAADASQFGNDGGIEQAWAIKTMKFAEVYFKLIHAFDPSKLKLTLFDDIIYNEYMRYFKNLKIDVIDEEELKSEDAKVIWRPFVEQYKGKIDDYNFGTLIRKDCSKDYSEENTTLVSRVQFYAIELARNRSGLNRFHIAPFSEEYVSAGTIGS